MSLRELFLNIANAIRQKDGSQEPIAASTFPERIMAIQAGSTPKTVSISFSSSNMYTYTAEIRCAVASTSGIQFATKTADTKNGVVAGILANTIAFVRIDAGVDSGISFDQGNWDFDLLEQGSRESGTTTRGFYAVMQLKDSDANLYVY